jgi:hypothetical protein
MSLTPESGHLVEAPGLGNQPREWREMDDLLRVRVVR